MPLGKALTESGGKAASFDRLGHTVGGTVINAEMRQARDLESGKPGYWDNGDPKENAIVTVQTQERDPSIPDDDGVRSIYIKWWGPNRIALQQEVRTKTAHLPEDQRDILSGGYFAATWSGEQASQTKGFSPGKLYSYEYRPPQGGLGKAIANGSSVPVQQNYTAPPTNAPPPQQYQQTQIPVQPQPAEQAPTNVAPQTSAVVDPMEVIGRIKTLHANGLDAVAISQLVPQYKVEAIAAILGV